MVFPSICHLCGKTLADIYVDYLKMIYVDKMDMGEAIEKLKIKKECCKSVLISSYPEPALLAYILDLAEKKK
jgi:DNA-directed RNA polymerase subunit N (RpoN/RPB10)